MLHDGPPPALTGVAAPDATARLAFVATVHDVVPPRSEGLTVVLDTAWTPDRDDPSDVRPLRPYFGAVLEQHDLFGESLQLLDRWAETVGLADILVVEGVTYWFRLRETMWQSVHERLLWHYTLAAIDATSRFDALSVPAGEGALIDVVRAHGRVIEIRPMPVPVAAPVATPTALLPRSPSPTIVRRSPERFLPAGIRRAIRRFRPRPEVAAAAERRRVAAERQRRDRFLADRLDRLSGLAGERVLVLTLPSSYQRIGASGQGQRRDPNLGSVIPALREAGFEPIVIGWGMGRGPDEDWTVVEADDRLLPAYFVQSRWARPEDDLRATVAIEAVLGNLDALSASPLLLDGVDMAPALVEALRTLLRRTIEAEVHELARVERLVLDVAPRAILMTQEGRRTPWLIAGQRAGIPTYALQHGVLYRSHPGYPDRRHPMLVLPTCTFVFGEYERGVLEAGAYRPAEVAVSGSPRLDLDIGSAGHREIESERRKLRRELGVARRDRMLVISTVNVPFVRRAHLVHMIEAVLGGPLPGVHLVFKQHPGERDQGPYRDLLLGLARAGGYESPPITVVKDIDLYRLLRAADAHLGLHSTVLTDAVVAGTCNLIAMVEGSADILGYVAAGVARPVHDIADLRQAMADPKPPDPDARRAFIDDHFRPGDASRWIAAAIRVADGGPIPAVAPGVP